MISKSKAAKAKIDTWYNIELKNLYALKATINRVKRQTMEWEKILANYIPDKRVICRLYKELL